MFKKILAPFLIKVGGDFELDLYFFIFILPCILYYLHSSLYTSDVVLCLEVVKKIGLV